MIALRPLRLAGAVAGLALLTSCGGNAAPSGIVHARAVTLLPTAADVNGLFAPTSRPNRYEQAISATILNPSFGSDTVTAVKLLSGVAEFDADGPSGTSLFAHVFVFKTLAGAESLTQTFLASNRLSSSAGVPSGAPGDPAQASTQPYGTGHVSYRYVFREQNVLSYIEFDGPSGRYSIGDAVKVASAVDRRVRADLK